MSNVVKTVYVGLSGGVDSSVAALRLQKAGYNVVGVFIKVWHPQWLECNWEQERLDAMRVAAHLDIPFLTCDAQDAYKQGVADYFIAEYEAGRTPNPDVMCNQAVKFGAFLDFALERGADYVATGHYAQCIDNAQGNFELHRGNDTNKDQSYFLYTLTQAQLQHIMFPVGSSPKAVIRKEAEKANIPVATKKDSQGVCFLGHIDIPEFLSHYIDLTPGQVLDEDGQVLGEHQGAFVYTIGQRQGFAANTNSTEQTPLYVVAKDVTNNTITVSAQKPQLETSDTFGVDQMHWIADSVPDGQSVLVQTRYRQEPFEATWKQDSAGDLILTTKANTEAVATGQSCVLYSADTPGLCLGGGILK